MIREAPLHCAPYHYGSPLHHGFRLLPRRHVALGWLLVLGESRNPLLLGLWYCALLRFGLESCLLLRYWSPRVCNTVMESVIAEMTPLFPGAYQLWCSLGLEEVSRVQQVLVSYSHLSDINIQVSQAVEVVPTDCSSKRLCSFQR
jgi:hypothetical protein